MNIKITIKRAGKGARSPYRLAVFDVIISRILHTWGKYNTPYLVISRPQPLYYPHSRHPTCSERIHPKILSSSNSYCMQLTKIIDISGYVEINHKVFQAGCRG